MVNRSNLAAQAPESDPSKPIPKRTTRRKTLTDAEELKYHRECLESAKVTLGVQKMEDWYHVSRAQMRKVKALSHLFRHYNDSVAKMLGKVYPEHAWTPWLFESPVKRMWLVPENHLLYFNELGKNLGVERLEDWYSINISQVDELGASGLLTKFYRHSLIDALRTIYPEHEWLPWKFKKVAQRWWDSLDNQRLFLDWAFKELNMSSLDDWYAVTIQQMYRLGGNTLTKKYKGSIPTILRTHYPNHTWQDWRFVRLRRPSREKVGEIMTQMARELGYQTLEDWYNISTVDFERVAGGGLTRKASTNLVNLLEMAYPEHKWDAHKFVRFNSFNEGRKALQHIAESDAVGPSGKSITVGPD